MSKILSNLVNIENGDSILLAVSGGSDSMALLDVVRRLADEKSFEFAVAHLNHSLRKEADKEEEAIADYCKQFGIPFFSKKVDLEDELYKNMTIEEAGREARYSFFDELNDEYNFTKLFTAHHQNDQVETILMRLIRGTGPEGLLGIREESMRNNLRIERPFLSQKKDALLEYCITNNVPYFEDKSNLDNKYTRNYIRNEIIPIIKKINPKALDSIIRTTDLLKDQEAFINNILEKVIKDWIVKDEIGVNISAEVFEGFEDVLKESGFDFLDDRSKRFIKQEVIRRAIKKLNKQKDISKKHIEAVLDFFESDSDSGSLNLPNNLTAIKSSGFYEIIQEGSKPCIFGEYELPQLEKDQVFFYPKNRITLKVKNGLASDFEDVNKEEAEVLLRSLSKLEGLTLRNRKTGDYVSLANTKFNKKLSRFMIDKKIPRFLRDSIPILALGNKIIWIPGYYIHRDYIVRNPGEKVTKLSIKNF